MSAPHELALEMLASFREQSPLEPAPYEPSAPRPSVLAPTGHGRPSHEPSGHGHAAREPRGAAATALAERPAPPRPVAPAPAALGPAVTAGPYSPRTEPHDLLTTLEHRRSLRGFSPDPLPAGLLADIMSRALDLDEDDADCPLELTVVAHRLTGIEPAIHRFDPAARSFTPVMELPTGAARYGLTLQPEFSDAAAIVSVGVPLDAAVRRHGGHGYRLLLTRAGSAAYAMWLDGVAHGLVGSVFAGFIPAAVRGPLLSDGTSRQQIFALALGLPPAP